MTLPKDFLALSQKLGADPLLVQSAGGNTSLKSDGTMWIKASGTLLADALTDNIFVAVDPSRALAELDGAGDGSCRSALIDPAGQLRPSIETTFHAMFPHRYVFHFHSIGAICHAIAVEGREQMKHKLDGLSWVSAPYRKPGIPLSKAIREAVIQAADEGNENTSVVILENHGVIVVGDSIDEVSTRIEDVENRLRLEAREFAPQSSPQTSSAPSFPGWKIAPEFGPLASDRLTFQRATAGTYYPDHVVFLGPALPSMSASQFANLGTTDVEFPVMLIEGIGVYIKEETTPAQYAMLRCLYDTLVRIPADWSLIPIGQDAEAELLNWDAEKYRQVLAAQQASQSQ